MVFLWSEQIKWQKPVFDSPAVLSRRENRNTCVAVRNVHPFVSADFKLRPFGFRLSACAAFYITHLYIAGNFVRIHRRAEICTEHLMRFPPVNLGCKFHDRTADGENNLLYNPWFSVCVYVFSCYRSVRQNYGVTRKLKFRRLFLRIIDRYIPSVIEQTFIPVYIELVEVLSRKLSVTALIAKPAPAAIIAAVTPATAPVDGFVDESVL